MAIAMPWFKFYPAEYLTDRKINELSFEERGILMSIWCLIVRQNEISLDTKLIAKQIGIEHKRLSKFWSNLEPFLSKTDTGYYSKRLRDEMEDYEEKANVFAERGRKAGIASAQKRATTSQQDVQQKANITSQQDVNQSDTDTDTDKNSTPLTPQGGATAGERNFAPGPTEPTEAREPEPKQSVTIKRSERSKKPPDPDVAAMLGGEGSQCYERFWKFVFIWPLEKHAKQRSMAQAWLEAYDLP